jgi:hypothetical protein
MWDQTYLTDGLLMHIEQPGTTRRVLITHIILYSLAADGITRIILSSLAADGVHVCLLRQVETSPPGMARVASPYMAKNSMMRTSNVSLPLYNPVLVASITACSQHASTPATARGLAASTPATARGCPSCNIALQGEQMGVLEDVGY